MQTQRTATRSMTAAVVMGILAASALAKPASAIDVLDDPVQIDDRLTQVLGSSNSLCWEMYRYHQQDADYASAYRIAKEIWSRADQLQDALRTAPMETETLIQQVAEINQISSQLEKTLAKWGDGDRSSLGATTPTVQRTVVSPGVGVNLPLIGISVGSPNVVVADEVIPQLQRHRLHPNSRGSKRSLERELAAMKVALSYLTEDAGITAPSTPSNADSKGPTPDPTLSDPNSPTPLDPTPPSPKK